MSADGDLGFRHRARADGSVEIRRFGRPVTILRGAAAARFLAAAARLGPAALQQRLARLTGHYRRGNERAAARHPRRR